VVSLAFLDNAYHAVTTFVADFLYPGFERFFYSQPAARERGCRRRRRRRRRLFLLPPGLESEPRNELVSPLFRLGYPDGRYR
jgi:hypothetical protein